MAATTTTTDQSISNETRHHHHRSSRVANLTKLIDVELRLLKDSFEEAKRVIDPVIVQINEAQSKFDQLRGGGEIMEMETHLRELKRTTGKLKSKIPFNLIAPEYQPAADPNVILQPPPVDPRNRTTTTDNAALFVSDEHLNSYFPGIGDSQAIGFRTLRCFLAFPDGAIIKDSLLSSFVIASWYRVPANPLTFQKIASVSGELASKPWFIKSVRKKPYRTEYGFRLDPRLRLTIEEWLSKVFPNPRTVESLVISTSIDGEEEDIIYGGSAHPSTMPSGLKFLHLGKWQRSPTRPHIEMPDPNLYFKHSAANLRSLRYISFRGVSVMKELPSFITGLWDLRILDIKACHHLEAIPSDIGNLWRHLTHLDMSECYFLDHMPASLSQLRNLIVLKGLFVGETNNDESCTLQDLSSMTLLVKLNIHTSLKTFPNEDQLKFLQGFQYLRNLTICWGGCSTRNENRASKPNETPTIRNPDVGVKRFSFNLEKLDLRGVPEEGTRSWLRPSNFEKLEKLYIRGGQLTHLRNIKETQTDRRLAAVEHVWSVKILRSRHLSKLQIDWSELLSSFPNLISVEKVDCPNFTSFPYVDSCFYRFL